MGKKKTEKLGVHRRSAQDERKRQRRLKVARFFLSLIFFAGLVILLYPAVSNVFAGRNQQTAISDYYHSVQEASSDLLSKIKEDANQFNQQFLSKQPDLTDAFTTEDEVKSEFPEGAITDDGTSVFDEMQQLADQTIATLEIPAINLDLPIYRGTSEKYLQKGLGWLEGSSLPSGGVGTHAVITGHRGLPSARLFTDLPELKQGDQFVITYLDEKLAYEVDQIQTVLPTETESLRVDPNQDYVTLITCTPYMVNSHRLFVRGHRVPYQETVVKEQKRYVISYDIWILIGVGVICLLILLGKLRKWVKGRKTL